MGKRKRMTHAQLRALEELYDAHSCLTEEEREKHRRVRTPRELGHAMQVRQGFPPRVERPDEEAEQVGQNAALLLFRRGLAKPVAEGTRIAFEITPLGRRVLERHMSRVLDHCNEDLRPQRRVRELGPEFLKREPGPITREELAALFGVERIVIRGEEETERRRRKHAVSKPRR